VATRSDSIVVLQLRKASKPGCVLVCHGTHMKWKRLATALRRPGIRRRLPHIAEVMFASGGRSPLAAYLFIRTLGARAAYDEWCGLPAKWGAPTNFLHETRQVLPSGKSWRPTKPDQRRPKGLKLRQRIATLPAESWRELREALESSVAAIGATIKPDDRVKIAQGPFKGFPGTVLTVSSGGVCRVVCTIFNRPTQLELGMQELEAV
jgi:hypothetical protein